MLTLILQQPKKDAAVLYLCISITMHAQMHAHTVHKEILMSEKFDDFTFLQI